MCKQCSDNSTKHCKAKAMSQVRIQQVSKKVPSLDDPYTSYLVSYLMIWKSTMSGEHVRGAKPHEWIFQNQHPQFFQQHVTDRHINAFEKYWAPAVK